MFCISASYLVAKFHKDFVMPSRDTRPLLNLGPFGPIVDVDFLGSENLVYYRSGSLMISEYLEYGELYLFNVIRVCVLFSNTRFQYRGVHI